MQSFWQSGIYIHRDNVFQMDIEQLVAQGKQGDEAAFEGLYNAYHLRMTAICLRIVGDRRVAEELAHDAFLLAFAKMSQLHDPRRFEPWLTSITTNAALRYKKRHHEPQMLSLDAVADMELAQDDIQAEEKPLPTMAELIAAVNALPNGYGQVFRLAVIENLSHKEIAEIMGIAAHSSSSQLTRAKKMLQKSLAQYWLLWLLPLLLPIAYFMLRTDHQAEVPRHVATSQEEPKKTPTVSPPPIEIQPGAMRRMAVAMPIAKPKTDSIMVADTIQRTIEQNDTIQATHEDKPLPDMRRKDTHIADLLPDHSTKVNGKQPKWPISLAYTGDMGDRQNTRPFGFTGTPISIISGEQPSPVTFSTWSDYAAFLAKNPNDGNHKQSIIMSIAQNNAEDASTDQIVRRSHHFMPVTWSLALKYRLTNRWGLETGLSYSRLKSEFEMGTNSNAIIEQQAIHYLGIPLKGTYNILNAKQWSLYGSIGFTAEIPVYAPFSTGYILNGRKEVTDKTTLHAPWQWSVGTGLGLQYNLTPRLGFFAEPSLQYFIPTGSSIETYRTKHPFTISLPVGIRITW